MVLDERISRSARASWSRSRSPITPRAAWDHGLGDHDDLVMRALRLTLPGLLDARQREALDVDDDLAGQRVAGHPLEGLAADLERRLAVAVPDPGAPVDGGQRDR